jgi:biotin transport system substrate-specific component
MYTNITYRPIIRVLFPNQTVLRDLFLALAGSLVVALTAQIAIPLPFTPVPLTGQTFGFLLVGALLGSRLGCLALLAYLLEGALGLPFFAGGTGGIARILGPTGGYLLAAPISAYLVGYLVERYGADRRPVRTMGTMLAGNIVLYLLGVTWLSLWLVQSGSFSGVGAALMMGMIPFLPGDLIKIIAASALLPTAWRFLRRRGRS